MPRAKLTPSERREIALSALSGASMMELSRRYGVARSWVYALLDEAKADPEGAVREAQEELEFRRAVRELRARMG